MFIHSTFADPCGPCPFIGILQMTWHSLSWLKRAGHLDARILVPPGGISSK